MVPPPNEAKMFGSWVGSALGTTTLNWLMACSASPAKNTDAADRSTKDGYSADCLARASARGCKRPSERCRSGRARIAGTGDVTKTNVVWRHTKGVPYVEAALFYQGLIYVIRTGRILTVFDPETGTVLKESRLKDGIGEYYAQPVAGDGKIYFVSEEGKISVIMAGAEWEMLSSGEVEGSVIATPAIADERIYLRTDENLCCLGAAGK